MPRYSLDDTIPTLERANELNNAIQTLDMYFYTNGIPADLWMTVGDILKFDPARKAYVELIAEYRIMRLQMSNLRNQVSSWEWFFDRTLRSKPKCRKRLQPIVRIMLHP